MPHLDPTYLRYIYDNLIKGSVHPDNASELPDGLIGLYEEVFEEHLPVLQRQLLLQRFALFALLKKEVSAFFVAEVLGESEQEISEFINTYASWFNSPEPGKFQLYHEHLKVYVMQKLSEKEMQSIHEKLIARLELAIEEQKADEFERYALEFLSEHLMIMAFECNNGEILLSFVQNKKVLDRQIELSNSFKWSEKGLRNAISFGVMYQKESVIECALGLVDLNYLEQNDAPKIVQLVKNGDIESTLQRIETYGGINDKEGLQRKFVLYIYVLFKVLHFDEIDKKTKKIFSEKLLKHLEDNIPINFDLLDWDSFLSYDLFFILINNLNEINVDYTVLMERNFEFDEKWINKGNFIQPNQFEHLIEFVSKIVDENHKSKNLKEIIQFFENRQQLELASRVKEMLSIKSNNSLFSNDIWGEVNSGTDWEGVGFELKESAGILSNADKYKIGTKKAFDKYQDGMLNDFDEIMVNLLAKEQMGFDVVEFDFFPGDIRFNIIGNISINYIVKNKVENSLKLQSFISNVLLQNQYLKKSIQTLIKLNNKKMALELLEENIDNFDEHFTNEVKMILAKDDNSISNSGIIDIEEQIKLSYRILKSSDKVSFENIFRNLENQISNPTQTAVFLDNIFSMFFSDLNNHDSDSKRMSIGEMYGVNSKSHTITRIIEIIKYEIDNCQLDTAILKYNRMQNILENYPSENVTVLESFLVYYRKNNLHDKFSHTINKILELIKSHPKQWRNLALSSFISTLYRLELSNLADEIIENESSNDDKIYIYEHVVESLVNKNSFGIAIEIHEKKISKLKENDIKNNYLFQKVGLSKSIHNISQSIYSKYGAFTGIENFSNEYNKIENANNKEFFKKGIVSTISPENATKDNTIIYTYLLNDIRSIEVALQMHALHCLFLQENYSREKIQRFNHTLNLEWAIDIKNQLPN